jgi:hypothetical protein
VRFVRFPGIFRDPALSVLWLIPRVRPIMNENVRLSGLALIAGSVIVMVTLTFHPSERGLLDPAQVESVVRAMITVHSLALVTLPLWFIGAYGLSRRVSPSNLIGVAGLVTYGFALLAMMNAVVIDGLVTPGLARAIVNATPSQTIGWKIAFSHNVLLDQAFVNVFLVASSTAIALWSSAIVWRGTLARAIGIFGCLLGAATLIGQFTGWLGRNPHTFGIALIGQALWFFSAGVQLCRSKNENGSRLNI